MYLTNSTHLADLGLGHTPECLSYMGEVMERYIDSLNPSLLGDPDNLRYAVGMSFVGDLKKYAFLNIPGADEADFYIQPAGVFVDMHLDLKNSLAWLRRSRGEPQKGKKQRCTSVGSRPGLMSDRPRTGRRSNPCGTETNILDAGYQQRSDSTDLKLGLNRPEPTDGTDIAEYVSTMKQKAVSSQWECSTS